jgi:hypothetical protein
MHAP